jgi:hypothetical protein
VVLLAFSGGPFLVALAFAFMLRRGCGALALAGVAIVPLVFLVILYLSGSSEAEGPGQCSDCELSLGRYWEPWFALVLAVFGVPAWLLGVAAGWLAGGLRGRMSAG